MDKQNEYEENVAWLKKFVPPDDIYDVTEQMIQSTIFFLEKWREWVDLEEECLDDEMATWYVKNIASLIALRDAKSDNLIKNYLRRNNYP